MASIDGVTLNNSNLDTESSTNNYDILYDWETTDEDGNTTKTIVNSGSITLNKSIEDYKYLIVFSKGYNAQSFEEGWAAGTSTIVPALVTKTDYEYSNNHYQYNNAGYTIFYGFKTNLTLDISSKEISWYTDCTITQVWGMK